MNQHYMKITMVLIVLVFGMASTHTAYAMSDKVIKQKIKNETEGTMRLRETRVVVDVMNGFVVLRGTVHLYIQKMLYEQIAWKTMGVVEVDNEIQVTPAVLTSDDVIKRHIMELLYANDRFSDVNPTVKVKVGTVWIHATFADPQDVQDLKHKIAEIQGVIEIIIQAEFVV